MCAEEETVRARASPRAGGWFALWNGRVWKESLGCALYPTSAYPGVIEHGHTAL